MLALIAQASIDEVQGTEYLRIVCGILCVDKGVNQAKVLDVRDQAPGESIRVQTAVPPNEVKSPHSIKYSRLLIRRL